MSRTKNKARKNTSGVKRRRTRTDEDPVASSDHERPGKKQATATDGVAIRSRPEQVAYDKSIANSTPEHLSERFTEAIKKFKGELSTIELEDQSLPAKAFLDTTDFNETRVVMQLPDFLEHTTSDGREGLQSCVEETGTPHTIIVTASAIRAQEVLAEMRRYGTEDNKIAKLYAKHMKLQEHIEYVEKTRFGIGAGSPHRIETLIEQDVLKLGDLQRVVIDGSYVDNKQRTIFSDRDAFLPTLSLLNLEQLKLRLVSGKTQVVVF